MTVQLRGGFRSEDPKLDRLPPPDWEHVSKYPLAAAPIRDISLPGVFGINWYRNFGSPVKDGKRYWIGRGDLGPLDGGHAIAGLPRLWYEPLSWWLFYDQGREGACVGFAVSRMMSLYNRKRYDARWLYHEAQKVDPWEGGMYEGASPQYEGSAVRAGFDVLRDQGHRSIRMKAGVPIAAAINPGDGVITNRWATGWEEVRRVLGVPEKLGGVPLLNSWGTSYPRVVWLTDEAGERVMKEDGEFGIVTDRP